MEIRQSFAFCENLARDHYENFPVASRLLPRDLRPYIACIYAFARTADDFADEGTSPPEERLQKLDEWRARLDNCYQGKADHPIFVALAATAERHGIPKKPFADLLDAFRLDVVKKRFATFEEVLDYCRKSANPVGQLVLYVFHGATERTVALSDNICTALQLANFWQDVSVDLSKGRIYIPLEDFGRFGYTVEELQHGAATDGFRSMMEFEIRRTREIFARGKPLLREVVPRLRFELSLTYRGGMAILDKISSRNLNYDVLSQRPILSALNKGVLFAKALIQNPV